jgi:hypothetical protein
MVITDEKMSIMEKEFLAWFTECYPAWKTHSGKILSDVDKLRMERAYYAGVIRGAELAKANKY